LSDISINGLEPNETVLDADLFILRQNSSGGTRREKKITSGDYKKVPFTNGVAFASGRFSSNELTSSATISTAGWYTIAKSAATASQPLSAKFMMTDIGGGGLGVEIAVCESTVVKSFSNTTVKLFSPHSNLLSTLVNQVESFRLAKSDTVNGSGFKVQAYLNPSSARLFHSKVMDNFSKDGSSGFTLVNPILENSPTLPDGITAATFLEAGAELKFLNETIGALSARKLSNDAISVSVQFPEIPKQGNSLVLTLPTTSLTFRDGANVVATITGAHTVTSLAINGKLVNFRINEIGLFTSLNSGPLVDIFIGTGGKLTIT
jgi:hypothetical protein